jgi:hypothetical protein
MRQLLFASLLVLVLLLIVVPETDAPGRGTIAPTSVESDAAGVGTIFRLVVTAFRDSMYLFGDLVVRLCRAAWDVTPNRLRPLLGLFFFLTAFFASVGFMSIGAARGLFRRLLG